ncbi:MAG: metal-sensing transcriptional repressor [Firmicutes bacterium]|nr:metal-sensing transcriptional repressor [Bacillota bacterium]
MRADKDSVIRKIKIARGQLDGILKMVDDDRYCVDISNQILATQALLKKVNQEVMRAHIEGCVKEALNSDEENPKITEALNLIERMI